MDNFYVALPSDILDYYFPANTIVDFRTKLATPLELEDDKWEVGLVEISYTKEYKNVSYTIHFVQLRKKSYFL